MLYWMTRGFGGAGGERDPAPSAIVPERRYITVREREQTLTQTQTQTPTRQRSVQAAREPTEVGRG